MWLSILLAFIPTEGGVALASSSNNKFRSTGRGRAGIGNGPFGVAGSYGGNSNVNIDVATSTRGGATKSKPRSDTSTQAFATNTAGIDASVSEAAAEVKHKANDVAVDESVNIWNALSTKRGIDSADVSFEFSLSLCTTGKEAA